MVIRIRHEYPSSELDDCNSVALGADGDALAHISNFELEVAGNHAGDGYLHAIDDGSLKSGRGCRYSISAGRKIWQR